MRFVRPRPLTTSPTVTVVVPCYNYGRYLPTLTTAVLAQADVTVDILIVDDASPDGSGAVADGLAAQDERIRVLHHAENRGHIQTYNDGLSIAQGDYVVLLSADDLLPAGALSRSVALMEKYPNVGLTYGFSKSFSGEPPQMSPTVRNWSIWAGQEWLRLSCRRGRCFIASPEVVLRTAAMRELKQYDPRLPHSADLDLWLRTALNWDVGRVNGPAQALYRVHDANMHLTQFAGMITDLRMRRLTFDILFTEHAPDRTDVTSLREPAMRSLARQSARLGLIGRRDGADPEVVREYLSFAEETWPDIKRTLLWRVCERPEPRLPESTMRLRRFGTRVDTHLRWRRWQRYGT